MAIAIGFGMLWLAKRTQIKGLLFGTYFLFSGAERLLIEQLRINTPHPALGGLTQAEAVSLGFILFGVAIMIWAWMRRDSGKPVTA
jgi:prolipoprotein diacylglyceryltransferase